MSNLLKHETLSGEVLRINTAVAEPQARGLRTDAVRAAMERADGSVQDIHASPVQVR
ncbi:hypothetical protein JNW88_07780 [Micromonospora sp. ATA32]|nr:hypothetical protein [Micromonospora sp. ATA32]